MVGNTEPAPRICTPHFWVMHQWNGFIIPIDNTLQTDAMQCSAMHPNRSSLSWHSWTTSASLVFGQVRTWRLILVITGLPCVFASIYQIISVHTIPEVRHDHEDWSHDSWLSINPMPPPIMGYITRPRIQAFKFIFFSSVISYLLVCHQNTYSNVSTWSLVSHDIKLHTWEWSKALAEKTPQYYS